MSAQWFPRTLLTSLVVVVLCAGLRPSPVTATEESLPHLADDIDAPVLVFVGDLPVATRNALREDFEAVQAFFGDRLGAPPADYTLYIGADAPSLSDVYRQIVGRESTLSSYCSVPRQTVVLISLQCDPQLAWRHAWFVLRGMAVAGVTPAGYPSQGPAWLTQGTYAYASDAYRVEAGSEELDRIRSAKTRLAARTLLPLRSLATSDGFRDGSSGAHGLGFLAVDWLLERAGERALFEYYRLLADSEGWEEAFEAAFGIAVDDFYEAFGTYRARVTTPGKSAEASEPAMITTTLRPGWNMVGWVGPETPASGLFDELPALGRIFAWDSEDQRYRQLMPSSGSAGEQHLLAPGDGLWLYISGTSPVEWTREASERGVILDLQAGRNLAAWAGRDGTPIEEAMERVGDRLERVWAWSADSQEYRLFAPNAGLDQVQELNHGDALLVELSSGGRWWQSGSAPPPVVLLSEYTDARQADIREWVDDTQAFFAERWGVMAPFTTYLGDGRESLAEAYRRERGRDLTFLCGDYAGGVIFMSAACVNGRVHAHEYFHAIQFHLMEGPRKPVPGWMIEGSATYAEALYEGYASSSETAERRIEQNTQRYASQVGSLEWPALSAPTPVIQGRLNPVYVLGFLAVDWLVDHAGEHSIVDFFTRIDDEPSWQESFKGAFGIAVDDFYEAFAAYRAEVAPLLPHLADDLDEPALVFVGDVPAETREAFRTELASVTEFFVERLGVEEADYTIFAGVDEESVAAAHVRAFGFEAPRGFCERQEDGRVAVINLGCDKAVDSLESAHFDAVRRQLAPVESLPVMPYGCRDRGPMWLDGPAEAYVTYAYRKAAGHADANEIWDREVAKAVRVTRSLADITTEAVVDSQYWDSVGVGFLALNWLAERAGEEALFEYYRLLRGSSSWVEPFERAFGMRVEDFYEAFERERPRLAPPFPHLTDDTDEPVLVFVGEVPSETRETVREEFDALRTFFRDELGAGTADYTVYIGADREAVVDAHVRVFGTEPSDTFCSWTGGAATVINLDCRNVAPYSLDWMHFIAVRGALAPSRSLPSAPAGYERLGPRWLTQASDLFVTHAYGVATGRERLDAGSSGSRISRTTRPLSSMESRDGYNLDSSAARSLGLLALEWLAERAGATALFDYYRRLPGSRSWEEAFEGAFGIAVDDFYEAFEVYRARVAPPLPHLTDGIDAPVLVFVGDLPAATRTAVREDFEGALAFFRDRLGEASGDYTVYVGADAPSLRDVYRQIDGRESTHSSYCSAPRGPVILISLQCKPDFAWRHSLYVLRGLAVPGVTPAGYPSQGPAWLTEGTHPYIAEAYRVARDSGELDGARIARARHAAQTRLPLSSLATADAFRSETRAVGRALGFLAVDWLVERAGERALFDYYRRLAESASWEEAFEAAFGIAVDDFYEAFEAYRAEVAPPG